MDILETSLESVKQYTSPGKYILIPSAFTNDALYVTEAQLNMILSSMNSTIDSLRDRIREIEAGATPAATDTTTSDTTVIPDPAIMVDGQPCPGMATITDYDGNVYNTVAIGQQCWMKENLRTTHSSTGSPIVYNTNTTIPKYGYLYSWDMAMRDICPLGWHVPTEVEWTVLTDYVSGQPEYVCGNNNRYIALAMAADTGWMTSTNDCAPGKNLISHSSTGFDILPAGFHNDLVFNNDGIGGRAYFWSSTQYCCGEARYVSVGFNSPAVSMINTADMSHGFSVRCVRDEFSEDDVLQMIETSPVLNVTPSMANCGGEVLQKEEEQAFLTVFYLDWFLTPHIMFVHMFIPIEVSNTEMSCHLRPPHRMLLLFVDCRMYLTLKETLTVPYKLETSVG